MHKAGVLEDERAEGQAKSGAGGLVLVDLLPGSSIGSHSGCRSALCGKAGEVSSCHGDVKGHVLAVKQADTGTPRIQPTPQSLSFHPS